MTRGLAALASEGWLETPFGAMSTGDERGASVGGCGATGPDKADLQVYEITPAGRIDARAAATHPIGSRGG